ncbi:MAG: tetratricopeptide repeat protein [Desulfobacterota bacterium]|nr:tetratricopeptide repeat protein [Thermodesulfobacteriota bacterium]
MDQREYKRALKLYRSLPWKSFGEVKFNGYARALTEMGFYEEARKFLEEGLKVYPDSYVLWVAMAALYETMGSYFEALECVEEALNCFPEDDSVALYNKALVLMRIGCYGEAREIMDELMERAPRDPKILTQRGYLALEMGYPGEALGYYQRAMKVWQEDPTLNEGISIYSGL